MGASGWEYYTPYREDLGAAFADLRRKVFEERDYYWVLEDEGRPWPETLEALWTEEEVQESGTHSILDISSILGPGERPEPGTLKPVTADEAFRYLGTRALTRRHVPEFEVFPSERWQGRCAVLHDERGRPEEICFWGASGD
ncbi:hypothetical protein ABZ707_11535 [Streptomyces sp. NPDC006923]|uniref:hypothetical protein n=1 Tax=Streptomyces sp. NPDC006923 TaxID=3155355 RepID=UPI0034041C19